MILHLILLNYLKQTLNKNNMTFHQIAYAKDNGKMKFYYDKNDLSKCYSLLPLPHLTKSRTYRSRL